jgi:carbon monoxide dehydrogenase subunit G
MLKIAPIALILMTTFVEAKTINKSFDVKQGGKLALEADVGSIHIDTHNKNTVLVNIEIDGENEDKVKVSFNHTNNKVAIDSEFDRSGNGFFGGNYKTKVRYTVTLPEKFNVNLDTSGGSINIENLTGKVDAHTSGGSISLERIQGVVDIKTSGGSITLDDISGPIDAHTSGGSIKVKLPKNPTSDSEIRTSGGSITAYLTKDVAVDLIAQTNGGRVSSEFSVDGKKTKQSIRGTINGGGPEMVLKTSGGNVRIKEM